MKRTRIEVSEIAEQKNLYHAAYLACQGRRDRSGIQRFLKALDENISKLVDELISGKYQVRPYRSFRIFDPKPRVIHAPAFRDRVVHHAIMLFAGPSFEKFQVDDSLACRLGKGTHAAIDRAQLLSRRFRWFIKLDIQLYFPSIDHEGLMRKLQQRFKASILELFEKIVRSFHGAKGKGIPIGALTSQYFANFYLAKFDRWIASRHQTKAVVRYMDDTVAWFSNPKAAKKSVCDARDYLEDEKLVLGRFQVGSTGQGIPFCGSQIFPFQVFLSRKRKKRLEKSIIKNEALWRNGAISNRKLQEKTVSLMASVQRLNYRTWFSDRFSNTAWVDV